MAPFGLLLVLAVPPPTTVNGQALGAANAYATPGPARICMRELAIAAESGETVYLGYSGIHNGTLRLVTRLGEASFAMSEIYAAQKPRGRAVREGDGWVAYQRKELGAPVLTIWRDGGTERDDGRRQTMVVTGSALATAAGRTRVLDSTSFVRDPALRCDRTYAFGWDVILGDEPLDRKGR